MEIRCPEHEDNGLTPKNEFCHDHASDTQQFFHNLDCKHVLKCPRALSGVGRQRDAVPIETPRNTLERIMFISDAITKRALKIIK